MPFTRVQPPLITESGPQPTATVLFIHGLGTDGAHYAPLAESLSRTLSGPVRFVFPTAPRRAVTLCQGQKMTAWFDLIDVNFTARQDEPGLRAAGADIAVLIEAEIERGIEPGRIFVAGFSQGGALSLLTGSLSPHRLGGVAALSGWLPIAAALDWEQSCVAADIPVFIGHGTADRIASLSMAETARQWLETRDSQVRWHTYPIGHSIAPEEIRDLGLWLRECLG